LTRINIIPVEELTDQHLMAEYREMFMVGSALQKSLKSPNWDKNRIPKELTLGTGHVMFFYDKGQYLYKRYEQIRKELTKRNYKLDKTRLFKVTQFPTEYYNDWTPTDRDRAILRERIQERINEKPEWYRHNGVSIV
jgi:deoxyribonuclease (pyrimidine dimer)|tara:strand:+ start:1351 stop:1761 length:411 start_codon:yes stop_codon:yes gene_type:complete